jgi:hypothetical protein
MYCCVGSTMYDTMFLLLSAMVLCLVLDNLTFNRKDDVEGQEHGPIEVAILAAFLFNRYKFLSRAKDKNLYRLPEWTRT